MKKIALIALAVIAAVAVIGGLVAAAGPGKTSVDSQPRTGPMGGQGGMMGSGHMSQWGSQSGGCGGSACNAHDWSHSFDYDNNYSYCPSY